MSILETRVIPNQEPRERSSNMIAHTVAESKNLFPANSNSIKSDDANIEKGKNSDQKQQTPVQTQNVQQLQKQIEKLLEVEKLRDYIRVTYKDEAVQKQKLQELDITVQQVKTMILNKDTKKLAEFISTNPYLLLRQKLLEKEQEKKFDGFKSKEALEAYITLEKAIGEFSPLTFDGFEQMIKASQTLDKHYHDVPLNKYLRIELKLFFMIILMFVFHPLLTIKMIFKDLKKIMGDAIKETKDLFKTKKKENKDESSENEDKTEDTLENELMYNKELHKKLLQIP